MTAASTVLYMSVTSADVSCLQAFTSVFFNLLYARLLSVWPDAEICLYVSVLFGTFLFC